MPKDKRTLDAAVLPFDYPYEEGYSIWPCLECLPWHVDLFEHPETSETWVREWHAEGCPIWEYSEEDE